MIFSSMNPSGERLDNLSGVAALLRYPLPGIDDIEEDDIDIDELINQEAASQQSQEDDEEEKTGAAGKKKNLEWDEEQLYDLLKEAGDYGDEGEEEEVPDDS